MTGCISGIKRMEIHDGDGLRTTVFFKGCPLNCIWCHNPESIQFAPQTAFFKSKCISCGRCNGIRNEHTADLCPVSAIYLYGRYYELNDLLDVILKDAPFFENGAGGVTLSGGECLAQPDFAISLSRALFEKSISVYIDTCGYTKWETLERIIPYTDKFLYDIKAIDPDIHISCTGKDNRVILENLRSLSRRGCKTEIRYPLVKGYNDGECEKIALFLKDLKGITKVKILQYHSLSASRYEALGKENTLPATETTFADIENAVSIFRKYGLNAVNGAISD